MPKDWHPLPTHSTDDEVTPRRALKAAVRHVRRELNATLDDIEKKLEPKDEEVRLKEPAHG